MMPKPWYGKMCIRDRSDGFPVFWREFLGEPFLHAEPVFRDAPGMKRLDGGIRELPGRNGNDYVHHFAGPAGHGCQHAGHRGGKFRMLVQNVQQPVAAQFSRNGLRPFQKFRKAVRRKFFGNGCQISCLLYTSCCADG